VFFHRASGTLVCSDLVFNIHDIPNLATSFMLLLVGARRRFTQTRTERWLLVKDRKSYAESLSKVLQWDFDRVVMGHGRIVDTGGHQRLADAVSWAGPDLEPRQIEA
jgi:glyoxylase-like metal-dependent hydrolase (beta-lactamase superfamily II)